MNHLIPYKLFEDGRTRTPSIPAGSLPKIDINNLVTGKDIKDPAKKEKLDNYMSNWFEKLGKGIENLGGDLIKDPAGWKKNYKAGLPGYNLETAGHKPQHITTDAGFSDIVAGGVSLVKGVLQKLFGSPETEPIDETNPDITPQHERVFVDRSRPEYQGYKTQDQMDDWARNKYKEIGVRPGEIPGVDRGIQASNLDWAKKSGVADAVETGGGSGIVGAAETALEVGAF